MEKGEKILQIFESSACLKADQMLGYLNGSLFQEELRVVELHLASCNLCQEALEGLETHEDAKLLIDGLRMPALPSMEKSGANGANEAPLSKTIFPPPAKKNHTAPSLPKSTFAVKNNTQLSSQRNFSWLGIGGIAALLLLGGFLFWQYENSNLDWKSFSMASNDAKAPVVADSNTDTKDTSLQLAANQGPVITKKAMPYKAANAMDSGKRIAVLPAVTRHLSDSAKAIIATTTPATMTANNNDAAGKTPAIVNKDSQNEPHQQTSTLAAVSPKKTATKTTTAKASTKPEEPEGTSIGIGSSDYQTGKSLFLKKQYASALLYLRTASENDNDPHHVEAMYYSALCNLQIGKTGRAKRLLKKVEKSDSPLSEKASEQLKQL